MSTNTDVILIKYQSDMSDLKKELVALTASNKKIETELKNIGAAGKKAGAEASEGFKKVGAVTKGLEGTFNSLKSQIAGVFATQQIISFGKEAIKAAAAAEGIERAFNRIAPEETLGKLREATKNTVSDVQLMANTVKASNFQIPVENLATLFKFAQQRARETGESVDYLVDSIVLGIGRKSPLILDNLGISAVRLREKFKGIAAEEINVATVAQAVGDIVEEETKKMGKGAETSADKLARYGAEWDNLKVKVGEAAISTVSYWEKFKLGLDANQGNFFAAFGFAKEMTAIEEHQRKSQEAFQKGIHETTEEVKALSDAQLEMYMTYETENKKGQTLTDAEIKLIEGKIEAIKREQEARVAAEKSNRQFTTASIEQLEAWIELGDTGAQKELARRKKLEDKAKKEEDERKKAYDDLVKREQEALAKSLKNNDQYFAKLANGYKQKFTDGEITEEELNHAISILEEKRLDNQLKTLQKQRATTKEVRGQIKDDIFKTESEITDFDVEQTKESAEKKKEIQDKMEAEEKERLASTLKDYQNYWQEVDKINVYFLREGLYTQEEFDAIQQDNKIKQLNGRLEVLKDFGAKTVETEEQVGEETNKTQKELDDEYIAENKRKNDKTTEDDKKAADDKEKIQKALYEATANLVTGFIDIGVQKRRQAADAEIEALQETLDKQLENEFLTEQQREALQQQFDEKRRQILNEQAARDKQAKIAQAVIDGIVSVIAATTLPEKIAVGILNAAQLALLIAAPLPQYKEGDVDIQGPGTDTSDSILARISRGESVINARSTRKHKDILKVINRGNDEELMKLIKVKYYPADEKPEKKTGFADNVLNQLKLQNKFDDSNIVKQLKGIRPATAKDIEGLGDRIERNARKASYKEKRK